MRNKYDLFEVVVDPGELSIAAARGHDVLGLVVFADEVDDHVAVLQRGHDGLLISRAEWKQAQLYICKNVYMYVW